MVRSFQQTLSLGVSFLFSFYLGLIGVKFLLAIVAGKSRSFLQGTWYRRIMQFLGFALIGFALFLLLDGLTFLGIYASRGSAISSHPRARKMTSLCGGFAD